MAPKVTGPTPAQQQAMINVFGPSNLAATSGMLAQFIPQGSLGRMNPGYQQRLTRQGKLKYDKYGNPVYKKDANGNPVRIQENQALLNRFQDLSKGMSASEYQATREQAQKGMDSNLNTEMDQLSKAQAQSKVFGAAAAAQKANALRADKEQRNDLEQQDKVANMGLIRQGTQEYAGFLQGLQGKEGDIQKFNIGQANAETAAQMGGFFNMMGMLKGNELTAKQLEVAKMMAEKYKG